MSKSNKNILFIMTGSIACYKACSVISSLHQKGYIVKVVMSPSSQHFVGSATIEGLTGQPAITDMYASGSVMDHIHLARWADLILVAPATANYINKIAYGLGDDLLTTLFLAHDFKKPFLLAPAMNTMMYLHPTTQEAIAKLKKYGVQILETASGVLACGEVGYGRLLNPELIVAEVESQINSENKSTTTEIAKSASKNIRVLITSGGTTEPIDDVRVITNKSTGKTAAFITEQLEQAGLQVDYVHAKSAALPNTLSTKYEFETFSDLENTLKKLLTTNHYDWVIHTAAVSDYSVAKFDGKISSDQEQVTLTLKKNPKLLNTIKSLNPKCRLIGFKLTSNISSEASIEKVKKQFESAACDLVVHNDWAELQKGHQHYTVFNSNLKSESVVGLESLSFALLKNIIKTESI